MLAENNSDDHPFLAFKWGIDTYVDIAVPFGPSSALNIFSAVADALAWVMSTNGVMRQIHYLFILGPSNSNDCAASLQSALEVCRRLGVPVVTHKAEGPATMLTFLGIQINAEAMQLSLAQEILHVARISALVSSWHSKRSTSKQELQSLIGHLSHAATLSSMATHFYIA